MSANAQDRGELRIRPEAASLISAETLDKCMAYSAETTAMRYFAAICITNRHNIRNARRALVANGYVHFADSLDREELWVHQTNGPVIFLKGYRRIIDQCDVHLGKPASRIRDLEGLLDELTVEDIQRI
jgi:hypothetical protein